MPAQISTTRTDNELRISCPYNPEVISEFRSRGGKWDAATKEWVFSNGAVKNGEIAVNTLFGSSTETVTVRVGREDDGLVYMTATEAQEKGIDTQTSGRFRDRDPVPGYTGRQYLTIGGYLLASRRYRDSGAEITETLVSGTIPRSGGSVKNPAVSETEDAVFELEVRRDFAERIGLNPTQRETEDQSQTPQLITLEMVLKELELDRDFRDSEWIDMRDRRTPYRAAIVALMECAESEGYCLTNNAGGTQVASRDIAIEHDEDEATTLIRTDIISRGPMFSGGTDQTAKQIAEEWSDVFTAEEASAWMDVGFWCPSTAGTARDLGISPRDVKRLCNDNITGFDDPVYSMCNNDLNVEAMLEKDQAIIDDALNGRR